MIISQAVRSIYERARYSPDPRRPGPVPLADFYQEIQCDTFEIANLSTRKVVEQLVRVGTITSPDRLPELYERDEPLEGFLFRRKHRTAFVKSNVTLGRRRFTMAHELGHMLLHENQLREQLRELSAEDFDQKDPLEVEANLFAAELLMPEIYLRGRADAIRQQTGACPQVALVYQLASELLVSLEALRYRLRNLSLGDE